MGFKIMNATLIKLEGVDTPCLLIDLDKLK